MLKLRGLYKIIFFVIFLTIFLIGGSLQLYLGVSNTGLTLVLCALMFFYYGLYSMIKGKIILNNVVLYAILYSLAIIISGVLNDSNIFVILLYHIFPLLPLSCYLFFKINSFESYISTKSIYKLILFTALIQLPILLIQRNFYDFLIQFNNSGQKIARVDFLFGSFFLKSDHSLGFFLFLTIIAIYFNFKNIRAYTKHPYIIIIYLSVSLLLAESNISKGLLILFYGIITMIKVYQSVSKIKLVRQVLIGIMLICGVVFIYNIRNIELITSKLGGTIENFSVERSTRFFNDGTAKREHIVVIVVNSLDLKYFGDGPYSYYDITTGKFKNTIHFSQMIWSYFDLGLIGLITVLFYLLSIIKSFKIKNRYGRYAVYSLGLIYLFYTTPFSEIGIIFSLLMFLNLYTDELNINSLS